MLKCHTKKASKKIPFWLPYTSQIAIKGAVVSFKYKGGECSSALQKIHSIMFYGSHCPLDENFLEKCRRHNIPICIHRRNLAQAIWILPSTSANKTDLIGKQILFRSSEKKKQHIARKLLKAKFLSMTWLSAAYPIFTRTMSIEDMRMQEAIHAKKYWRAYFSLLEEEGARRGNHNPVKSALDAVSKFCSTVILRWALYHKLSPNHGFLHIPTYYPSLVYDLMEPLRGYVDRWVFKAISNIKKNDPEIKDYVGPSIDYVKKKLYEKVFVYPTQQIVSFQELFHGSVLALRAYLVGDAKRFIPPYPNTPKGGRPVQSGYRLYGRSAGPTDFWETARKTAQRFEAGGFPSFSS